MIIKFIAIKMFSFISAGNWYKEDVDYTVKVKSSIFFLFLQLALVAISKACGQ